MYLLTIEKIENILNKAHNILSQIYPQYVPLVFTNIKIKKANSYWGMIQKRENGTKYELRISESFKYFKDPEIAQKHLEETIVHECIHTLPKCFNHGEYFKYYGNQVRKKFGINPLSKYNSSDIEWEVGYKVDSDFKYKLICKCCGKEYNMNRKPRLELNRYICSKCNRSKFELQELN